MKKLLIILVAILTVLSSCQQPEQQVATEQEPAEKTDKLAIAEEQADEDDIDTVSVKVKMQRHSKKIVVAQESIKRSQLSEAEVKELETWWDSLPKPVQSQIKANKLEIQLVSNIHSANEEEVSPRVTDTRIENTGAALERIIGGPTDMTFTVNTTLTAENVQLPNSQTSTDINLVKKVNMKLKEFEMEIPLAEDAVKNQDIQTLQYWWSTLPDDLRQKIQRQEVFVNLTCVALDKGMDDKKDTQVGELSNDLAYLMSDVLNQMIGTVSYGDKSYPMAKINKNSVIERMNTKYADEQVNYVIRLQLRNNKMLINAPSM